MNALIKCKFLKLPISKINTKSLDKFYSHLVFGYPDAYTPRLGFILFDYIYLKFEELLEATSSYTLFDKKKH